MQQFVKSSFSFIKSFLQTVSFAVQVFNVSQSFALADFIFRRCFELFPKRVHFVHFLGQLLVGCLQVMRQVANCYLGCRYLSVEFGFCLVSFCDKAFRFSSDTISIGRLFFEDLFSLLFSDNVFFARRAEFFEVFLEYVLLRRHLQQFAL